MTSVTTCCAECPFARHLDGDRYICTNSSTARDVVRGHWEVGTDCIEKLEALEMPTATAEFLKPAQPVESSRRNFLMRLAGLTGLSLVAVKPVTQKVTQPSPIPGVPAPKFWFGDRVSFYWTSDDDGLQYSESGNVVGICWSPLDKSWVYSIVWTDSIVKDPNPYPIFDERLTLEKDLGLAYSEGELCK